MLILTGATFLLLALLSGLALPAKELDTSALWYVAGIGLVFGSCALGLKTLLDRRLDRSDPR
jgi:hypothetical protein